MQSAIATRNDACPCPDRLELTPYLRSVLRVDTAPRLRATNFDPRRLARLWPDACWTSWRPALPAALHSRPAWRRTAILFQDGLLRAPSRIGLPPCTSTVQAIRSGATLPSLGEHLAASRVFDPAALRRAKALAAAIVEHRLGGACYGMPPQPVRATILFVPGDDTAFTDLLRHEPAAKVAVLAHPSNPIAQAAARAGCQVLDPDCDPWPLLDRVDMIHAPAGSEIALLAELAGRPVRTEETRPPRPVLAAAHLIAGTRYAEAAIGRPITPEAFLDRAITWRRLRVRLPRIACCTGIAFWKRSRITDFLGTARIARTAAEAVALAQAHGGAIATWPSRTPPHLVAAARIAGVPLHRVEDGFIRSRGLGADFIPPASIVLDQAGIYYDPSVPSDLERLLLETDFPPDLLHRATRLARLLVGTAVTKYNQDATAPDLRIPSGRRSILVAGQVANDGSVLAGGGGLGPGLDLLRRVRALNPDAYILYKPHPDVSAGHRPGALRPQDVLAVADQLAPSGAIPALLDQVDELHTLTSLAGFEALLRRRTVVTYGRPFYAGWGLTTDITAPARPRRLSLEALVAGTLILYPYYIDPVTRLPCGPEELVEHLAEPAATRHTMLVRLRRLHGRTRRYAATLRGAIP